MNIVLVEPQIPPNTGNIARLCAATNTVLYLVGPLGFSLEDKYLKRAGLDYWSKVEMNYYNSFNEFLRDNDNANIYYFSTKGDRAYTQVKYEDDDFLVFGNETAGLPDELLLANSEKCITIPMFGNIRSLNVSAAVAIVLYESLRQTKGF